MCRYRHLMRCTDHSRVARNPLLIFTRTFLLHADAFCFERPSLFFFAPRTLLFHARVLRLCRHPCALCFCLDTGALHLAGSNFFLLATEALLLRSPFHSHTLVFGNHLRLRGSTLLA